MRHNKHSAYVYACDLQFMVDGSVWGFFSSSFNGRQASNSWGINALTDTDRTSPITTIKKRNLLCEWSNPHLALISFMLIIYPIHSALGSWMFFLLFTWGKEVYCNFYLISI